MAPDTFDPDQLIPADDGAGQSENLMREAEAAAPGRARPTLFQMVCLQGNPRTEPPIAL